MNAPTDPTGYRILHDNGQEYGPVSADTMRGWIREGRAHARTRVKVEGAADWRLLGELPEFSAMLRTPTGPPVSSGSGKTSAMAITSLVLGVLGLVSCGVTSLIGLILGIVSLVKINKSRGELRGAGLAIAGIVVSAVLLLLLPIQAALILPALAKAKQKAQTIRCVNNLKQLGLAARIYETDHGVYPGTNWCDVLKSTGGIQATVFECPGHQAGACAYALNLAVAGRKADDVDPATVLFFESDLGYNACAGQEAIIQKSRHSNVVNVGFADGSVQQINESQTFTLQWEP
jgi:prepilin-type processing-associated H-X9-DG protein